MARVINRRFLFAYIAAIFAASAALGADRPNILFVFTDDQAPWAVGASGYGQAKTPNMDRLFREGAYLVNAYTVTPVCSPSRASLMTSRYGTEVGITDWLKPQYEPSRGLGPQWTTWPQLLQRAGYYTGLVGKWHLGLLDSQHPTRRGYDYFMGFRGGGTTPDNPTLEIDGNDKKFTGLTTDILTDHAIEFLRRNSERPFALSLHYRAPHAKWLPVADADWAPYENMDPSIPNPDYPKLDVERVKRMTREYLASVRGVDRNLGRVLATLDESKIADKTVVIFSSDHGYNMGHNGIWHKGNGIWVLTDPPRAEPNIPRNQRPNMYDNSIRVPTAVRWPGVIRPGTTVTQTISNLDWFPTLLAIAGAELPSDLLIRGRNFLPLLRGERIPHWDNTFYAEYSTLHQSSTHMRMIRTDRWKLIRDFRNPYRDEFYDMVNDPAESNNLIRDKRAEVRSAIEDLHAKLIWKIRENSDPVLDLVN